MAVDFSLPIAPRIREGLKHLELRTSEDLSWSELGRRVWAVLEEPGDSTKWVSRIKLGQQLPSVPEAGAIAQVIDVSPMWLCWGIGEMGRFPTDRGAERASAGRDQRPPKAAGDRLVARKRDEPTRKRKGA